jgi:outer membrane protein TolC
MKKIGCILCFTLFYGISNAQLSDNQQEKLGWDLPPLQTLIDSAIANAISIKLADATILTSQYRLKDVEMNWLEKINLTVSGNYGNSFDWARTSSMSQNGVPAPSNSSSPNLGYTAGVSIYYPLTEVFGGRKRIKQVARLNIDEAVLQKEGIEQSIKGQIIAAYYDLQTILKTMEIQSEMLALMSLSYEQAKTQYADNRISLTDYTELYQSYIAAKNSYETQKNEVMKVFRTMELITGIKLLKQ